MQARHYGDRSSWRRAVRRRRRLRRLRRPLLAAAGACFACAGLVATADAQDDGVTRICHATGSLTTPYVLLEVGGDALEEHRVHPQDLIPAPAAGCPASLQPPTATTEAPPTVTEPPAPDDDAVPPAVLESEPEPGPQPAPPGAGAGSPATPAPTPLQAAPPPRLAATGAEPLVVGLVGCGLLLLGGAVRPLG